MSLHHIDFLLVFPLFFIAYWASSSSHRNFLLLMFNVLFYFSWGAKYFFVVLGMSFIEWLFGKALRIPGATEKKKDLIMFSGIFMILGNLVWFKYLGQEIHSSFLPVGLSYQILMGISYLVDLRHELIEGPDLKTYLVYKTFFPTVVMGPITRFKELGKFLQAHVAFRDIPWKQVIFLFSWGFFKKSYCGDYLSNEVVTPLLSKPEQYNALTLLLGYIVFPVQVYCDFSGYSSMARALALALGLDLPINFNYPFLSTSFNEFWNRWHMSLSHWLRDYIFFPIHKSLMGHLPFFLSLIVAILLTWLLGGLWHGAGLMYVMYGLMQGLFVSSNTVIDHYRTKALRKKKLKAAKKKFSLPHAVLVFLLFGFSILLFLSPDMTFFVSYLGAIFKGQSGLELDYLHPCLILLIILAEHVYGAYEWEKVFERAPAFILGSSLACLWIYIILVAPKNYVSFVYFKF